jgi:hypothetical protein
MPSFLNVWWGNRELLPNWTGSLFAAEGALGRQEALEHEHADRLRGALLVAGVTRRERADPEGAHRALGLENAPALRGEPDR